MPAKKKVTKTTVTATTTKAKRPARKSAVSTAAASSNTKIGGVIKYVHPNSTKFISASTKRAHKFVNNFIMSGGTLGSTGGTTWYRMNGMYDPETIIGGHQPYGFDQMAALYNTFTVTDIEINLHYAAPSDPSCYLVAAIRPSGGTFNPSGLGVQDVVEKDNVRWFMTPETQGQKVGDSTISLGKIPINYVQGVSRKAIIEGTNYSGSVTADPTTVPQFGICLGNVAGASDPTMVIIVELIYHAIWSGPRTVGQS